MDCHRNSQYAANYGYDAVNWPTSVSWTPAPAAAVPSASSVTFLHKYNAANQRIGQTVSDNGWINYPAATASTVSYTANALNQYTAVGSASPAYDGNGNLTSDGTFTYGYDAENRLISASGAGNTASYAFDAQGRRKSKTVNGATTVFVTDADNREVLEYDGGSGAIRNWYAYGLGPNDVLNQINVVAGTRTTLLSDIQGSIIASLDSGSGTLSRLGYMPYGTSASAGPFGYTGQRVDPEVGGLYYYRARHYSPAWGRFLQSDPIGYAGGLHLYAYVGNDPLNAVDPSGLAPGIPQSNPLPAGYGSFASPAFDFDSTGPVTLAIMETNAATPPAMVTTLEVNATTPPGTLTLAGSEIGSGGPPSSGGGSVSFGGGGDLGPRVIYRGGSSTPTNLTPRPGVDTGGLSANINPLPGRNQIIDTSKFDILCAVCDNPATGHVTIFPRDPSALEGWAAPRGTSTTSPYTRELMNSIIGTVRR